MCEHPGLQLGGWCYYCLKGRALNGHRSKLTLEQQAFVGLVDPHRSDPLELEAGWHRPDTDDPEEDARAVDRELQAGYWLLARRAAGLEGVKRGRRQILEPR